MSAQLVKELRERTGAGMMDCMNAIKETNGDIEAAIKWLQEKGAAKAAKKAGAVAAEGVVNIVSDAKRVIIYEVNSQTDFVASNADFQKLVNQIGQVLLANNFTDVESANALKTDGKTIAELCIEATATIGEKILLRRVEILSLQEGQVAGIYVHFDKRIASALVAKGGKPEILKNVAMHIASMNPQYLDEHAIPAEQIAAIKNEVAKSMEKAIAGKPVNVVEGMINGKYRKQLADLTLVDQEFVMEKMPVATYLSSHGATAVQMARLEVGEGVAKQNVNFAEEVKAQVEAAHK